MENVLQSFPLEGKEAEAFIYQILSLLRWGLLGEPSFPSTLSLLPWRQNRLYVGGLGTGIGV